MSTQELLPPSVDPAFKAVLIGGGAPFANGRELDTHSDLLDAGLGLTGKSKPNVLLIPSARWKSEAGVTSIMGRFATYFTGRGLATTTLHPFLYAPHSIESPSFEDLPLDLSRVPSSDELSTKIGGADYVFTLGGDTNRMLNQVWKPLGIDRRLKEAIAERGTVMSGSSAGAVAWFESAQTDGSSLQSDQGNEKTFHVVDGLDMIHHTIVSPHYDATLADGRSREADFHTLLFERRALGQLGMGIDNFSAIVCKNGRVKSAVDREALGRKQIHTINYRDSRKAQHTIDPSDGEISLTKLIQ